jgi:toxin HigB-1
LEITFVNRRTQTEFSSEAELTKKFGRENAKKIMMRLVQLQNVDNLSEVPHVPPPRRHELHGIFEGCFAVDVKQPFRLIFRPSDGERELGKITKITILEVANYHDG